MGTKTKERLVIRWKAKAKASLPPRKKTGKSPHLGPKALEEAKQEIRDNLDFQKWRKGVRVRCSRELKPLLNTVLDRLERSDFDFTPEEAAIFLAMGLEGQPVLVLLHELGSGLTLRAWYQARYQSRGFVLNANMYDGFWLTGPGEKANNAARGFSRVDPILLRSWLLHASQEQIEEAELAVTTFFAENPSCLHRAKFAFLFPNRPDLARQILHDRPQDLFELLSCLNPDSSADRKLVLELVPKSEFLKEEEAWALLDFLGEEALPPLRDFAADSIFRFLDLYPVLSRIESPEAARAMNHHWGDRKARKKATAYFEKRPHFALEVLAGEERDTPGGVLYESILLSLEKDELDKILPQLSKASRKAAELLGASESNFPEATLDELPTELLGASWKTSAPLKARKLELELPRTKEWIEWPQTPLQPYYNRPVYDADQNLVREVLNKVEFYLRDTDLMDDETALRMLDQTPIQFWSDLRRAAHYNLSPLLARFGLRAIPFGSRFAVRHPRRFESLAMAVSPLVAPAAAVAFCHSDRSVSLAGAAWLRRHPVAAALGCLHAAATSVGEARRQQIRALRLLDRELVRKTLQRLGEQAVRELSPWLEADPLMMIPEEQRQKPLFWDVASLPPIALKNGKALPKDAVETLGVLLANSPPGEPHPAFAVLRTICCPESLDRFAWSAYSRWEAAGWPSEHRWAFHALGYLGGDECIRRLVPFIRRWPQESAFARAVQGLDVLTWNSSDLALMYLDDLSRSARSKALRGEGFRTA